MCCCHFIDRPNNTSGVTDIVNMVAWCLGMVSLVCRHGKHSRYGRQGRHGL